MPVQHSATTHASLIEKVPSVTGHDVEYWMKCLQDGPGLLRVEERASWLRDEHELPPPFAAALVHEHNLRRGAQRTL